MKYKNQKLTHYVKAAGCAAKLSPGGLKTILNFMQKSPALLSGIGNNEDASVYKLNDELALVQTLDFITPIVDSAYHFGSIAAANSLSDVFAMGAEAINALNIVGFDKCNHDLEILKELLEGANDKVSECGALVVGGHTIESSELFFGLSVTGVVNPKEFIANNTAKVGDLIVLTKPLGVGILSTALKGGLLQEKHLEPMLKSMQTLNLKASRVAKKFGASAMSDVTGFGLLGHLSEMLNDLISIEVFKDKVPFLEGVKEYFDMGLIPGGAYRNCDFVKEFCPELNDENLALCDPQTSGGLLVALKEDKIKDFLKALEDEGSCAKVIAQCLDRKEVKISLKNS
ncbi:MAG: selenide, water dikinase SelD [Campylobacter sp.]|nr:selenide, water dikinase SelD [Campylobacter sp.]